MGVITPATGSRDEMDRTIVYIRMKNRLRKF